MSEDESWNTRDLKKRLEIFNNRLEAFERSVNSAQNNWHTYTAEKTKIKELGEKLRKQAEKFDQRLTRLEKFEKKNHKRILDLEDRVLGKPVKFNVPGAKS